MGRITSCIPADRHEPSGPCLVTSRSRFPFGERVNVGGARERDEAYLHLVYGSRGPLIQGAVTQEEEHLMGGDRARSRYPTDRARGRIRLLQERWWPGNLLQCRPATPRVCVGYVLMENVREDDVLSARKTQAILRAWMRRRGNEPPRPRSRQNVARAALKSAVPIDSSLYECPMSSMPSALYTGGWVGCPLSTDRAVWRQSSSGLARLSSHFRETSSWFGGLPNHKLPLSVVNGLKCQAAKAISMQ
ncbi:hypothetical protein ACVWY3_004730 [Bradyrhizobium sp. USDA 4486]